MERLSSISGAAMRGGLSVVSRPALTAGGLHEVFADPADWAAALGFALGSIGSAPDTSAGKPIVVVRRSHPAQHRASLSAQLYGEGLAGLGIDPARLLIVRTRDDLELLRAGLNAARCPGLAAVVLETWGDLPRYDLTASRRMALAVERSGVSVVVLRGGASPRPSAARSRWMIRAALSTPLAARAPGAPAMEAELLRQRSGPAGMVWRLEWDDGHGTFRSEPVSAETGGASLSGAVVPLAFLRADTARSCAA